MIDITTLDLLKYMGQRPPMYIGEYDIFSLKAFLDGLAFQRKSEDEGLVFLQQVFYPWLKEKYALEEEQLWAKQLFYYVILKKKRYIFSLLCLMNATKSIPQVI